MSPALNTLMTFDSTFHYLYKQRHYCVGNCVITWEVIFEKVFERRMDVFSGREVTRALQTERISL